MIYLNSSDSKLKFLLTAVFGFRAALTLFKSSMSTNSISIPILDEQF